MILKLFEGLFFLVKFCKSFVHLAYVKVKVFVACQGQLWDFCSNIYILKVVKCFYLYKFNVNKVDLFKCSFLYSVRKLIIYQKFSKGEGVRDHVSLDVVIFETLVEKARKHST